MITFKYIEYRNINSVGNNPIRIDLNTNKSSVLTGGNGAGKSTLLDALAFGLYGTPYREINKPTLVNSINKGNLLVEVSFETGGRDYVVKRGIKPNIFEIYENNKLIDQNAGAYDYQEILEKNILKMDFKAFAQIIAIGKVTYIPFMNLKPNVRRQVIEDLLDLQVFTNMNILNKDKINTTKRTIADDEMRGKLTDEKIKFIRNNLNKMISNTQEQIDNKLEYLEKQKAELSKNVSDRLALGEELKTANSEYLIVERNYNQKNSKYNEIRNSLAVKRNKIARELEFFKHTTECPTCTQNISDEFRDTNIKNHELELNDISDKSKQLDNIKSQLDKELEHKLNKALTINNLRLDITKLSAKVKSIEDSIEVINKDIELLNNQQTSNKDDISQVTELQTELKALAKSIIENQKLYELYKSTGVLLKDSGIKAQLIKKYIPIINQYIEKYLGIMDFFVQFDIDENFEESIKSRYRDMFKYNNFSEGEKFRIDLALLITWRDVASMRNSCRTNILILDEVFDGSLDDEGVEAFMAIVDQLITDKQTVFVISHNSNIVDKFDTNFVFKKVGNFTQMTEEVTS